MRKTTCAWTAAAATLLAAAAGAQTAPSAEAKRADADRLVELVRKDVRAEKSDIVAKTMKLDASQAAAFWPVYKAYEAERQALGDQRVAVIQDLAEHFQSLDDAKAKALLDRAMANNEQRLALERKYKDEFLKVLPARVVARFFQVESRLNNLIDLAISSEIPLVP
jgi:Spy/CpxP family protein refolding chaperone